MQVGVLCNMAELVVRQLEKSWAAEQLRKAKDANLRLVCCCLLSTPCAAEIVLPYIAFRRHVARCMH
jgi:hypothetical protein